MAKFLIVDDEPPLVTALADSLQRQFDALVDCAPNRIVGAHMLAATRYDLAIIDARITGVSGFAVADLAANENVPVLLIAGHPAENEKLLWFDYPYLSWPFSPTRLHQEAAEIMQNVSANIRRVKASSARLQANVGALKIAIAEAGVLFDALKT